MTKPAILCYMNHFYNRQGVFNGKSTGIDAEKRKYIVKKVLDSLNQLENSTVKVCGIEGSSLIDLDITFNDLHDSRKLIFASLVEMSKHIEEYDYFLNIEDDILVSNEVLSNIYKFDELSSINEVLLPNRLETDSGLTYCVDTKNFPGWINTQKRFQGKVIKVAINPHSGILILSKKKFQYAVSNIDLLSINKSIGGIMASSFAHFHQPFTLYRSKDDIHFHSVTHLDKWAPRKASFFCYLKLSSIRRFLQILPRRLKFHVEDIL